MEEMACKLVVVVYEEEVHSVNLGTEAVRGLIDALPTCEIDGEIVSLFEYFARSPASGIRCDIARHEHINDATLDLLAADEAINVRREIAGNSRFLEWASTDILTEYIQTDIECAKTIASGLEDFSCADVNIIAELLRHHPDPEVRLALAGSWGAPKRFFLSCF